MLLAIGVDESILSLVVGNVVAGGEKVIVARPEDSFELL